MRAVCISSSYCQYKTDTGYCGYTGMGCAQGLVRSVRYDDPTYTIVRQVELTDENINKIAEAVVERLRDVQEEKHGKWINDDGQTKCSICGSPAPIRKVVLRGEVMWEDNSPDNYCPNCGAKMEELGEKE